ncbi:hypothetical protein K2173_016959 [Erythroxylum novogranatense]|uniref:Peroxiredoxin-like 2A n=1 Tax=Erythroxylum novogranatense TaxID=1862640 RepID=A0AAV8U9K4_9ROSI|nr:hypothetical protein K2173_016959 [Erythroxylum novogranatense]
MASYSMEDFVGNGALKQLLPKLLEEGWDEVQTLKLMNSDDMHALNMTQQQKDAVEIRTYLHDRTLIQYGDALEASGKCLPELLSLSNKDLTSQFGMKRGHYVRFSNRTSACAEPTSNSSSRKMMFQKTANDDNIFQSSGSIVATKVQSGPKKGSYFDDKSVDQSQADMKTKDGHMFKGIVSAGPPEPRVCGCIKPPPVVDVVAPYSSIEGILIQKLTPEYKIGTQRLVKTKTPPLKASALWQDKPAVFLCIRRPGCIMCRAEAHQLYAKKPIFDRMGVQLYAVLHEHIESEVQDFWPRYWGGVVLFDRNMEFFKALGGGQLLKDKFLSGFLFNPRAIANYKRAKALGIEQNFKGEGEIKGGLFIVGSGKSGIAYQFVERNFGDWAPLEEIIGICSQLQNQQQNQEKSIGISRDYE